jgi:hypothetical protein
MLFLNIVEFFSCLDVRRDFSASHFGPVIIIVPLMLQKLILDVAGVNF